MSIRSARMDLPSSSAPCSYEDVALFKSLIYNSSTFLNRCRSLGRLSEASEFHLLQGSQNLLCKRYSCIFEKTLNEAHPAPNVDIHRETLSGDLNTLCETRLVWDSSLYRKPVPPTASAPTSQGGVREVKNHAEVCFDLGMCDEEREPLVKALNNVGRRVSFDYNSLASGFDDPLFSCFLYCDSSDSEVTIKTFTVLPLGLDTDGVLHMCRESPTVGNVCDYIYRSRAECRHKLSQADIADDISDSISSMSYSYTPPCIKEPDAFAKMIVMLWSKITNQSVMLNTRIWQVEGHSIGYIGDRLVSHLTDLLDDVLPCPCDYSKWSRVMMSQDPFTCLSTSESIAYDSVYHYLGQILEFSSSNSLSRVFDSCIDVMFSLALRHPNPCVLLECILKYMKTVLIPSLPLPGTDSGGMCVDESTVWFPRLCGCFESLLDFEYLSLHYPLFLDGYMEDSKDGCNCTYSTSIPRVGCYVMRVDIAIDESSVSSSIHKPAHTSTVFRICLNAPSDSFSAGSSITFVSDGHQMMVFDKGFALIGLHSKPRYSVEFLFDNCNLLVYLNHARFYVLNLVEFWRLDAGGFSDIGMSISVDESIVTLSTPSSLSPGFRRELMQRRVVLGSRFSSAAEDGRGLLVSLYDRHLYLLKVTSFMHQTLSRIIHIFKAKSPGSSTWSEEFVRYLRTFFDILLCNLQCIDSICTYFGSLESVNAVTLWRMISDSILSVVSTVTLLLSTCKPSMKLPDDMLQLIASCFIGCANFRPIASACEHTDRYHLQFDLDNTSRAINMVALRLVSSCPDIFIPIFSRLGLNVLVDILLCVVSVEHLPSNDTLMVEDSICALNALTQAGCVAIFTKRSLSHNSPCFPGGASSDGKIANHWWDTISSLLSSERGNLRKRVVFVQNSTTSYCTCESPSFGSTLSSPFFVCCYGCIGSKRVSPGGEFKDFCFPDIHDVSSYYSSPRPRMVLCRLLLKHGVLFLCLNSSVSYHDIGVIPSKLVPAMLENDYAKSFERFGDWKNSIVYSSEDDFLSVHNVSKHFRLFRKDDMIVLESITLHLLRYNEFIFRLLYDDVSEMSSDVLNDFGSRVHNFINALSVPDILSYLVELFEHFILVYADPSLVHQSLITCGNLMPSLLQVIIWAYKCLKRYFSMFEDCTIFSNYISLQFQSLVYLLGTIIRYMYNNCKRYTTEHLLSEYPIDKISEDLMRLKVITWRGCMSIPAWLLRGTWLEFDDRSGLYSSLNRLAILLQDFKYEGGTPIFTLDFDKQRPLRCKGTLWAIDILNGDASAIDRLSPRYLQVSPSLNRCQLCITAAFIHLLDSDLGSVDIAIRYASRIVFQLLRQLQSVQTPTTESIDEQVTQELRQRYVDDICARCTWLVNNTRGALYYAKSEVLDSDKDCSVDSEKGISTCSGLRRSRSLTHLDQVSYFPTVPSNTSSERLRSRTGRFRSSALVRSRSADSAKDTNLEDKPHYKVHLIDICVHLSEITSFLLYGPRADACECQLYAERLSMLCRYSMWHCANVLICLLSDSFFIGGEGEDESYMSRPLLLNLLYEGDKGESLISSDGMHSLVKLLWYNIVKISRSMVIRSTSDSVISTDAGGQNDWNNVFERILLTAQSFVLEKMCIWYLRSGVRSVDYARAYGTHIPSWVRISLPFFGLLFSLGIDPMNNSRYAIPMFQHLLDILQPLRVNTSGEAEFDSYVNVGIGSILVFFISYNVLRLCSASINSLFHALLAERYSKRDFKKLNNGILYIWVKNVLDMHRSLRTDELGFKLLWFLGKLKLNTAASDLERLTNVIHLADKGGDVADVTATSSKSELLVWQMFPSVKYNINCVSFMNNYTDPLSRVVDFNGITIPIYLDTSPTSTDPEIDDVYMSFLHHLGGKLEVEMGTDIWAELQFSDTWNSIHPMRAHLHYLLRFILWTCFSSNLYSSDGDLSDIDISCCLSRLLLKSLRDVAAMLVVFNSDCSCNDGAAGSGPNVSFRYVPDAVDDRPPISLNGILSSACDKCTSNMLCRCEIENFWLSILTMLVKEIERTIHYGMAHYILNCLLTTFALGDDEIDALLSSPNLGPAFCEIFVVCIRKLGQEHVSGLDYLLSTADVDSQSLVSPALHGMFLYRWLPPLQRSPVEYMFSCALAIFQSVLVSEGYAKILRVVRTPISNPFSALPHSENFVTHRTSEEFEADINGNTLHIVRAVNMGGIVLFHIPLSMCTNSSIRGRVNFFVLSPGRFGITVAPADCIFGSVTDLFDRNDVVGFLTPTCPPFVHDVFAATINYRVGDALSAAFTIDHQDDGQICLRTELLIAGNSIGSVLEVVYDPITQNAPIHQMSLVFIFQDPQTLVYNGLTDVTSPNSDRVVSRDTQSTFRSDSTSEQLVDIPSYAEELNVSDGRNDRHASISSSSIPVSFSSLRQDADRSEDEDILPDLDDFALGSDYECEDDISPRNSRSLEKFTSNDWDPNYDVKDGIDNSESPLNNVLRLCDDDMWLSVATQSGPLMDAKSKIMFAESIQLYQSILITSIPLLSGLKEEVVGQMCLSFETLYYKLLSCPEGLGIEEASVRDCFSWLCVIACDIDSDSWKRLRFNYTGRLDRISDFDLPWLLGSSSTSRSCVSRLSGDICRKLLLSLSHLLSLPCMSRILVYTLNKRSCSDYISLPDCSSSSLILALSAKCVLCCIMLGRVLCEKGCTFDLSDPMHSEYLCIDELATLVQTFISSENKPEDNYVSTSRVVRLMNVLGIFLLDPSEVDITPRSADRNGCMPTSQRTEEGSNPLLSPSDNMSLENFWQILYGAVKSNNLVENIVQSLSGHKAHELVPNPKMFATCDYTFHCGSRIPSQRRHFIRRTLRHRMSEHDIYDLTSMLVLLSPEYFLRRFLDIDQEKGLRIFRSSITHFVQGYDFNGRDYWYWGHIGNSVSVESMDLYSRTVDPLYGWQRLFYMEGNMGRLTSLLDILFTELLYCIALVIHDYRRYLYLCDTIHWILDSFIRHPLCSGLIRRRFVSSYVWSVVHTMLVNCSSLPCKLSVIASRLTAWLIPISSRVQLNRMFVATHYCGSSAFHRVSAVCKYFNIVDLDVFTSLDLKRHDHATRLASAMLVHMFASTLSLLLEHDCEPIMYLDDIMSISQYMLIANHPTMYAEKFLRHLLGISEDMSLHASVRPYHHDASSGCGISMTHTSITASNFRTLFMMYHVGCRSRLVICNDIECRDIITETLFYPDVVYCVRSWDPVYVEFDGPYPLDVLRRRCCLPTLFISRGVTESFKDVTFRVGFLTSGMDEFSSPSSKVHFEDNFVYLEVMCESEISQSVMNNEVIWHYGQTTVRLTLSNTVELLRPFVSVIHPCDSGYTEEVTVRRNSLKLPVSCVCCFVSLDCKPMLKSSLGCLRLSLPFRSGISLSTNRVRFDPCSVIRMDLSLTKDIVRSNSMIDLRCMNSKMSLPFSVSCVVQSSNPDFYVGLEWMRLRFLWLASGRLQCPMDAPVYKYGVVSASHVSLRGVGFSRGDVVCLRFVPEEQSLLFILNNKVCMVLDFRRLYRHTLLLDALVPSVSNVNFSGRDLIALQDILFDAIISDNVSMVRSMIDFVLNRATSDRLCVSLFETPFQENTGSATLRRSYAQYNALYLCCLLNRLTILKCISVMNVDFDRRSGSALETPLMAASKNLCNMAISYLVCVLRVDVNARDTGGNTALMYALGELEPLPIGIHERSKVDTVKLLVSFGGDILARNNDGCTLLDLLPSAHRANRELCNYLIEQYKLKASYQFAGVDVHHVWPGLLGGSTFICGINGAGDLNPDDVSLQGVCVDDRDLLVDHCDMDAILNVTDRAQISVTSGVEFVEATLEKIRRALSALTSKISLHDLSEPRYLHSRVHLRYKHPYLGAELIRYLRGFVQDLLRHRSWAKCRFLSQFARISLELCSRLSGMTDPSEIILAFLNYERCVSQSRLLSRQATCPITTLQSYRGIFQGSNLLHCTYSMYSNDYLAISSLNCLSKYFGTFNDVRLRHLEFSGYDIPVFCGERIQVSISAQPYAFNRIRYHVNRDISKDIDFAIHCIADLLNTPTSTRQVIADMVIKCRSTLDVRTYLPPLDSSLWNGIYTSVESILECFIKLRLILLNHLECDKLDEVEVFFLLQHLSTIVDDSLKSYIRNPSDGCDIRMRLRKVVEKLHLINRSVVPDDGDMRIISYSSLDSDPLSTRSEGNSEHSGWGDCIFSAFCYVIINDRISLLNHVNDTFRTLAPIIGTVLNQPLVEYLPLDHQLLRPYSQFVSAPSCLSSATVFSQSVPTPSNGYVYSRDDMGICLGPSELPVHWSVYFGNRSLIRRSLVNEMYRQIFPSLQNLNRERPYFSIRVDRGIASTGSLLKHTLWYQSCTQLLNCNPNILRSRNGQRPFMVIFKGEGATDFGGPFQELLSCISNEVMGPLNLDSRLMKKGNTACLKCPNATNSYGLNQDTVMFKFSSAIHPMVKVANCEVPNPSKLGIRCGDHEICCSSGCCSLLSPLCCIDEPTDELASRERCRCGGSEPHGLHCNQGIPMELTMYESLGRLFAMCVCMMNPLSIALNPIIWKKLLASNLSLKDLADCDKLTSDLLHKLKHSPDRFNMLDDLTFSLESDEGRIIELLSGGSDIGVTRDNLDLFVTLVSIFRLTQSDIAATWVARGFNAVLPIGRFRMLLDYKLLEFMVCGDPRIDLEVLRAHTVSSSMALKRDLFDVLANFDNARMQMFLRFVSGRSRLPPAPCEWNFYVEYEPPKNEFFESDNRLPTSSTCAFRLLIPRYSSKDIMHQRLLYAIEHCVAIDLDAYHVHDEMELNV